MFQGVLGIASVMVVGSSLVQVLSSICVKQEWMAAQTTNVLSGLKKKSLPKHIRALLDKFLVRKITEAASPQRQLQTPTFGYSLPRSNTFHQSTESRILLSAKPVSPEKFYAKANKTQ